MIDENMNGNKLNFKLTTEFILSEAFIKRIKWQDHGIYNLYYIQKISHATYTNIFLQIITRLKQQDKTPENGAYHPRVTERTIMRISAIKIPNTISFTFMFCSHIFRRIEVPEVLKSCAWKQNTKFMLPQSTTKAFTGNSKVKREV